MKDEGFNGNRIVLIPWWRAEGACYAMSDGAWEGVNNSEVNAGI